MSSIRSLLLSAPPARLALVALLTGCLGVTASGAQNHRPTAGPVETPTQVIVDRAAADRAAAEQAASRAHNRAAAPTATPTPAEPSPSPAAAPGPSAASPSAASPSTTSPSPNRPAPVAGLTQAQMGNAQTIVETGLALGVPRRGLIIAVATAMQESNLYNLASGVLPESLNHPNQGIGWDHDSVGLFQQRTSTGWGAVADLMRPAYAAQKFYEALLRIPGWRQLGLSAAAQAVQVSAFPDAYARHEARATTIVDALL